MKATILPKLWRRIPEDSIVSIQLILPSAFPQPYSSNLETIPNLLQESSVWLCLLSPAWEFPSIWNTWAIIRGDQKVWASCDLFIPNILLHTFLKTLVSNTERKKTGIHPLEVESTFSSWAPEQHIPLHRWMPYSLAALTEVTLSWL